MALGKANASPNDSRVTAVPTQASQRHRLPCRIPWMRRMRQRDSGNRGEEEA